MFALPDGMSRVAMPVGETDRGVNPRETQGDSGAPEFTGRFGGRSEATEPRICLA
jgi:hypothetical protein